MKALWALVLVSVAACGRTPEPAYACEDPGDACEEVRAHQANAEAVFAQALAANDSARADDAGACVQLSLERSLELACVLPCDELCRLHPCAVRADDGEAPTSECSAHCTAKADEGVLPYDAILAATQRAGERPGFCTCAVCASEDDPVCTELFSCP